MSLPFSSTSIKASIYVKFDEYDIEEVIVLLMQGIRVLRANIFGKNIDENDENLKESIINEETDSRMVDEDTKIKIKNISDNYAFMEVIYESLEKFHKKIEDDIEYIIYNENIDISDFFNQLCTHVVERNDYLEPIHFKQIFTYNSDIKSALDKYQIDDHMYSPESSLSNALYSGILFDKNFGR